jgi:hypothetical protein
VGGLGTKRMTLTEARGLRKRKAAEGHSKKGPDKTQPESNDDDAEGGSTSVQRRSAAGWGLLLRAACAKDLFERAARWTAKPVQGLKRMRNDSEL